MHQIIICSKHVAVPSGFIPVKIDRTSLLGNPFTIKASGSRANAIELYRKALHLAASNQESPVTKALPLLRNLVRAHIGGCDIALVCHCAPKPCHGDVIKRFIEWAAKQTNVRMAARSTGVTATKKATS